ncbi:MAG TPA: SDR family oxidoreductase [Pyrinomonadaceae bacterium]|nr:SDR family oxidoreductase [Pyrinomonadaceae bacterium]
MGVKLKRLEEQVIVITGASSGIGLTTARMAAERGARVVVASRNQDALHELALQINSSGGEAIAVVADVGHRGDVQKIAAETLSRFGGVDTWVNNAGVSIYGKLEDIPVEDMRQLFETNFWGVVYGSLVAAEHLKSRGGAIVNVGSVLSDRAIPLQGIYCASKHAVKGFTDSFRMELEAADAPISVTLIKPSAIDTPYLEHSRNYLDVQPENPPPVYSPDTVADAILHAACNPVRDLIVGGAGKIHSMFGEYAPRIADQVMESTMLGQTRSGEPAEPTPLEGLYEPKDSSLSERGTYEGHVAESSLYTKASKHPVLTGAAFALGAGALAYTVYAKRNARSH